MAVGGKRLPFFVPTGRTEIHSFVENTYIIPIYYFLVNDKTQKERQIFL